MRLKQYITEATLSNKFIDYLDKNCQPFLKEFGLNYAVKNEFIYRGLQRRTVKGFNIIKARKDRKPRLISQKLHEILDEYTKKLFGWKVRSEGIFTGSNDLAINYTSSQPHIFIPIGNYKYIYTLDWLNIYMYYDIKSKPIFVLDKIEKIKELYKKRYKTKGLNRHLNDSFEAIFKCDEYFVVDLNNKERLQKILLDLARN